jgi:hypothetical protein
MATYAVIHNNIITNTIVCEEKDIPLDNNGINYIEYTYENPAVIGLRWDGETFEQPISLRLLDPEEPK